MKTCSICERIKNDDEFYSHSKQCKPCYIARVKRYYAANKEKRAEYERKRFQQPKRRAAAIEYQRKRRERNPEKYKAVTAVGNAIRDGRLIRQPCEICGEKKVEAHHDDYSKPLEVRWLCRKHHLEHHGKKTYED